MSDPEMDDFCIQRHIYPETLVDKELWRYLPVINVDKVADIPANYPGVMGVPITFVDKHDPSQFEILDCPAHMPKLETGRTPYKRIMIRNLNPTLPKIMLMTISGLGRPGQCPICGAKVVEE